MCQGSNKLDSWPNSVEVPWLVRTDVFLFFHNLVHFLIFLGVALCGGHGCGHFLIVTLRVNQEEEKFLVLDQMTFLHFLSEINEMEIGTTTSCILYNWLPKVWITLWGIDSYIAICFHKYGWPKITLQSSRGLIYSWSDWWHRVGNTIGRHEYITLGGATWWCMAVSVVLSVVSANSIVL